MATVEIDSIDDPRIDIFRDLKSAKSVARRGLFVAEGSLLVDRLLASDLETVAVLADSRRAAMYAQRVTEAVPVYCASPRIIEQTMGYNFHRGVLAAGRRPAPVALKVSSPFDAVVPAVAVIAVDVQDPDNLGGILRNCAAFGVERVILMGACADPYSRRVLRVSMGTVFRLQLHHSRDPRADLEALRSIQGYTIAATLLDDTALDLRHSGDPRRLALVFGNEGHGLPPELVANCDLKLTIPMRLGTNSLNVAVASGVFLYHFTRRADAEQAETMLSRHPLVARDP